jgi:hypothetical protein
MPSSTPLHPVARFALVVTGLTVAGLAVPQAFRSPAAPVRASVSNARLEAYYDKAVQLRHPAELPADTAAAKPAPKPTARAAKPAIRVRAAARPATRTVQPARPAAPNPPAGSGSGVAAIYAAFGGSPGLTWALRVARCESGYNPRAYNPSSGASGLFQFLPSTWYSHFPSWNIWDPYAQARAARIFYDNGWQSQWTCR